MKTYSSSLMSTESVALRVTAYFTQLGVSPSPQQMAGECFQAFLSNHANSRGLASASRAMLSAIVRALAKSSSTPETPWSTRPTSMFLLTGLRSIMCVSVRICDRYLNPVQCKLGLGGPSRPCRPRCRSGQCYDSMRQKVLIGASVKEK